MSDLPKSEIKFDEDTGLPVRRVTIQLKGRTKEEIDADIDALFNGRSRKPNA